MTNLSTLLSNALLVNSSMKTRKYFFGNSEKPIDDFQGKSERVVETIKFLAALKAPTFNLNGEIYSIDDYLIPAHFQQLIAAGKVFANSSSMDVDKALYKVVSSGDLILAPNEFNIIFNDYNEGQDEARRLKLKPASFSKGSLLSELSIARTDDDQMVKLDGNVISGEAAELMGVTIPFNSKYFKTMVPYSKEELIRWLLTE